MSNDPTHSHVPQPEGQSPQKDVRAAAEQAMVERARRALEASPETIGPYRIIEKLGQGGMGEVYRAEQRVPIRRQVAIKLIKLGMDTKQVIARFEAERQALALMDHPHIAKVLDASTDDSGRPYFVMEYVKGIPINEYADKNQLTIQERLGLFGQVCHAIQHAHHKGVIHRDIKPSNVLTYTQDGKPHAKIIDFGIAKAIAQQLTDQTFYTLHSQFLGTPQYMSPEQAEGNLDIDTRTDVYSLGVMLYELLTGTTPFSIAELKAGAVDQIRKIICETEPPKPSTRLTIETATLTAIAAARRVEPTRLGALVRGELDWIVMMALDKDRRRRYDTPNDLADDIEAYLQGERVKAAPPSRVYLMQKFVRKNKGAVAIASILGTSLGVGLAGTSWQWFRADRNAKTAELSSSEAKAARQRAEDALQQAEKERALAIEQRDNAEFEAYVANLNFANAAVERGEYPEAQEYLKRCPEKHRGWEWDFLNEMTFGNSAFMIQEDEAFGVDSSKRTLVKVQQNGQGEIYRIGNIDKPTSFTIPFDIDVIISSMDDLFREKLRVVSSADGKAVYLRGTLRTRNGYAIIKIDLDGKCQILESSEWQEVITASGSGKRVVTRLQDNSYRVFNFEETFNEEIEIPAIDSIHFVGFTNASDSKLVFIEKDVARAYEFLDNIAGPRITILDQSQLGQLFSGTEQDFVLLPESQIRELVPVYLDASDKKCKLLSDNNRFCVLEDGTNQFELWNIIAKKQVGSFSHHGPLGFSIDSRRLVKFNSQGVASDYQMYDERAKSFSFSNVRQYGQMDILSDLYIGEQRSKRTPNGPFSFSQWVGRIKDRHGRLIASECALHGKYSVLPFDLEFLENKETVLDRLPYLCCHIEDLMLFPSTSSSFNAELIDLCAGMVQPNTSITIESGIKRRFTTHKDFLRVEDPIRMRRLVDFSLAFPKSAKSILLSNDAKRIYILDSDDAWVCYDTRSRGERKEWYERVFDQKLRAESIVDALWDSEILFSELINELRVLEPIELCEAALLDFEPRQSAIAEMAFDEFNYKRFLYVGRKEDWLFDENENRSKSRLCRADGPLAVLIEGWDGDPSPIDYDRFSKMVLTNELPEKVIFKLPMIARAYMASVRTTVSKRAEETFLISTIALIRAGQHDEAKRVFDGYQATGSSSDPTLRVIRSCTEALFAIRAMDQAKADECMALASMNINSMFITKKNDAKKFYDETLDQVQKLKKEGK